MKTSAQRDLREPAGNVLRAIGWFPSLTSRLLQDTSSSSSRLFPPRGVDEDMLDKDQILLQKEAEVRTTGSSIKRLKCISCVRTKLVGSCRRHKVSLHAPE